MLLITSVMLWCGACNNVRDGMLLSGCVLFSIKTKIQNINRRNEWMNEWMQELMNEWMNARINEWMNECKN